MQWWFGNPPQPDLEALSPWHRVWQTPLRGSLEISAWLDRKKVNGTLGNVASQRLCSLTGVVASLSSIGQ